MKKIGDEKVIEVKFFEEHNSICVFLNGEVVLCFDSEDLEIEYFDERLCCHKDLEWGIYGNGTFDPSWPSHIDPPAQYFPANRCRDCGKIIGGPFLNVKKSLFAVGTFSKKNRR